MAKKKSRVEIDYRAFYNAMRAALATVDVSLAVSRIIHWWECILIEVKPGGGVDVVSTEGHIMTKYAVLEHHIKDGCAEAFSLILPAAAVKKLMSYIGKPSNQKMVSELQPVDVTIDEDGLSLNWKGHFLTIKHADDIKFPDYQKVIDGAKPSNGASPTVHLSSALLGAATVQFSNDEGPLTIQLFTTVADKPVYITSKDQQLQRIVMPERMD